MDRISENHFKEVMPHMDEMPETEDNHPFMPQSNRNYMHQSVGVEAVVTMISSTIEVEKLPPSRKGTLIGRKETFRQERTSFSIRARVVLVSTVRRPAIRNLLMREIHIQFPYNLEPTKATDVVFTKRIPKHEI